jgi:hypothetical protein
MIRRRALSGSAGSPGYARRPFRTCRRKPSTFAELVGTAHRYGVEVHFGAARPHPGRHAGFLTDQTSEPDVQTEQFNSIQIFVILRSVRSISRLD